MTDVTPPKSKGLKKDRIKLDTPDSFMRALTQCQSHHPNSDPKEED